MLKTLKHTLPIVVFIILAAGGVGLWLRSGDMAVLVGGLGAALISGLLFYAVINWDEAFERKKEETRQLADVVNHAMDAIMVTDRDGVVLYANKSAQSAYDIRDLRADRPSLDIIGLNARKKDRVLAQVLSGEPWNGELRRACPGGRQRIYLTNIFQLERFREHTPAVVSIGRDLTQRKALEHKLRHSQKLAAVGELASGVAHEINNPMAAIQSQIGLARDYLSLDSQLDSSKILSCIEQADEQVQRCSRIVQSLLRFSNGQEGQPSQIKIDQAIELAIQFVRSLSKLKDVEVLYEPQGASPLIKSDVNSISQVLVNLMVNAADSMEHRGQVRVRVRRQPGQVVIDVLDQGCGISAEHIERVFEPFFTTKAPGAGTGLGLSISYGLAQSLGGELSLSSQPGGGTCASLALPAGK